MNRFNESGRDYETLKQMSAEEVENLIYPPENIRRKDVSVMPDYQAVYERLSKPGSKANLFYLWLKYKKECPSGYQYTQYCHYFKKFIEGGLFRASLEAGREQRLIAAEQGAVTPF